MNKKNTKNFSENTYEIFIYGNIGEVIDGNVIAQEIRYADEEDCDSISIHINSAGGSIVDAYSIIAAIQQAKTHIITINDGLAASAAGIILLCGNTIKATDYSRLMLHFANIGGETAEETKDKKTKNALVNFNESLSKIIVNRTGLNKEEVDKLMLAESWYDANKAKKMGFIDEIIKTKIKNDFSEEITDTELLEKVCNIYTEKENKNIKIKNMENLKDILTHVNFDETKNEVDILEYIKNLEIETDLAKAELNNEKAEIVKINDEIEKLKAENVAKNKTIAISIVEQAIAEGKYNNRDKQYLVEKCEANIEDFTKLTELISLPAVSIVDQLEIKETSERDSWTYKEYSKKDPKALLEIKENNTQKFIELYKNEFGAEPKI